MDNTHSKERAIKNCFLLYFRMLFTMIINLYATRLILSNLGVEDYGIYGVVGSVVGFFSIFTNGLTNAVQRFISFEAGKPNGAPDKVFCTSLNMILLLALGMLVVIELFGMYFLTDKVQIPDDRLNTAKIVFHLSVITSIVNLVSTPYNALVIAHEKMNIFASISIIQVIINCAAAYMLSLYQQTDRLFYYALFVAMISLLVRVLYQVYCNIHFKEAKYHFLIDRLLLREIGKYTGVSTVSGSIQIVSGQGIVLLLNYLYGVGINAVYSIARQMEMAFMSFGLNVYRAYSPQIIKTYANKEYDVHKDLVISGCKMDLFMLYFIFFPFLMKTDFILGLWLTNVPEYTVSFVRWSIVISMIYAFINPIADSVRASNKVTAFLIIPELVFLLVLPIGYLLCSCHSDPRWMMVVIVLMEIAACIIKVVISVRVTVISLRDIVKSVLIPCVIVGTLAAFACYEYNKFLDDTLPELLFLLLASSMTLIVAIFIIGLNSQERRFVIEGMNKALNGKKNKG